MVTRLLAAGVVSVASFVLATGPVSTATNTACRAGSNATGNGNEFWVAAQSNCPPRTSRHPATAAGAGSHPIELWVWRPVCEEHDPLTPGGQGVCTDDMACPAGKTYMRRWRLRPKPVISTTLACMPTAAANRPEITPGMVLNALRRVPLPRARTYAQPKGTTLVNLDTILHTTTSGDLDRSVRILGQTVRLHIHPASYTWAHGDGTGQTTQGPGDPYPARTVTHRYQRAHTTARVHVTITWTATYRVNGRPSQPVPGTVTTTGPDTTLRIAEAVPALSGEGH